MKKTAIIPAALIFFISCNQNTTRNNEPLDPLGRYQQVLDKFQPLTFDTLHVYSPSGKADSFRGVPLKKYEAGIFLTDPDAQASDDGQQVFAVYRFPIGDKKTGLIARTPSMYRESSVKLFVFNKILDSITHSLELAESWGDAGDVSIKEGWLFHNSDFDLQSLIRVQQRHYNSAENTNDTIIDRSQKIYLISFREKLDTLMRNAEDLSGIYHSLLKDPLK